MSNTIPCRAKDPHTCPYHSALIKAEAALAAGELDIYLVESSAATAAAKTDRDVKAFFVRQAKTPTDVAQLKPVSLAGVKKTDTPLEALAKLNTRRAELIDLTTPAKQEQDLIRKQIEEQTTLRWQQEPPHDYVGENDEAGFRELTNDAWNNTGAHNYKKAYMKSLLGEYARSDGYNSITMVPSVDVTLPYIPDEDKLNQLADGLARYAKFVTDHEDIWASERGAGALGDHYWKAYKAEGHQYVTIAFSTTDHHESGILQVRIYPDGTAVRCFTRYSQVYTWRENSYGGSVGGYGEDVNMQDRRPLLDVLRGASKDWYYPAESKPGYKERTYDDYDDDYGYGENNY